MSIKTIFLDRDGVINKEVKYLHKINEFQFINGVSETFSYFQKLGYKLIIVTNQSGISRGYYTENDYQALTKWMLARIREHGNEILDIFHCPHDPKSNCACRKPKPGMIKHAIKKYNIDINKSWMIGDQETDIQAANSAGIENTILVRSGHIIDKSNSHAKFFLDSIYQSKQIITS